MLGTLRKMLGIPSRNERIVSAMQALVARVSALEPGLGKLTDEQLLLVLRPKSGVAADEALLDQVRRLNAKLSDYKRVSGVVVLADEFPRTASQKIKRDDLARVLRGLRRDQSIVKL